MSSAARSWNASDGADRPGPPAAVLLAENPSAVMASACLMVLAHHGGAPAIEGVLTDPASGYSRPVALPWRSPLRAVVRQVAAMLETFPTGVPGALDAAGTSPGSVRFEIRDGHAVVAAGASTHSGRLLSSRLEPVLRAIAEAGARPAGATAFWSREDERVVASAHRPALPRPATLLSLVRERITSSASEVGLSDGRRDVTYAQLGEMVDRFAAYFERAGVRGGDVVGVGGARRAELVATLLAVWSVGAAFLPVDPHHPHRRLEAQLAGTDARFVVLPPEVEHRFVGCQVLDTAGLDTAGLDIAGLDVGGRAAARLGAVGAVRDNPGREAIAYAMATSGSTGRPKVVGVSHGALAHCVTTFADLLGVDAPVVAGVTALTFDISLLELFLPLVTGGRLVLADEATRRDPARLGEWLTRNRPDVVQATPTGWRMTLPHLGTRELSGTVLLCGGEAISADLARDLLGTGAQVWNVYGPTEATIWCTAGRVTAPVRDPVPIGRPVPGTVAAVLDRQGRPATVGQVGELYVGGAQLAIGYLGDAGRTAASFVDSESIGLAYRTGDLCSWRPDGTLVFHGRADNQVKLRGHRVELEEIEAYAEADPGVGRAAAVLVEAGPDDQRLVLYVQPATLGSCLAGDLRARLARWLPAALMPQHIVELSSMPFTANQKVDRRALREAARADVNRLASEETT